MSRVYLSAPHMGPAERQLLFDAFDSNWIAPAGPHLAEFERTFTEVTGTPNAVALSSGTAALHLALLVLGVGPGDDVLLSDLTFAATANAVTYVGARPVLIDAEPDSWNMDPDLLAEELEDRRRHGRPAKAVIPVDLYGQCADYRRIVPLCREHEVPIVEDAAEALGASLNGEPAGSFGTIGVFSFNGNKIITTSSGGMLTSNSAELVERARYLSTQARDPVVHYEHQAIGFNYRMSNLLAAIGTGQLRSLADRVERRRAIGDRYRKALASVPGISFMPEPAYSQSSRWLTCITVDRDAFGASPEDIRQELERHDIESRPTWKPMHLQPVFAELPFRGTGVSTRIFSSGLCLPSGSSLDDADIDRVAALLVDLHEHRSR